MYLQYVLTGKDRNLIRRFRKDTSYISKQGQRLYLLRVIGWICATTLLIILYIQIEGLKDISIVSFDWRDWRIWVLVAFAIFGALLRTAGIPVDYGAEKTKMVDYYRSQFDVTISNGGFDVVRGAEEPFSISWEDILSYENYKQLIFIEYRECVNYLVIPESVFSSKRQKDALWALLTKHVPATDKARTQDALQEK